MDAVIVDMEIDLELARARLKHPEWPEDIVHQAVILAEQAVKTLKVVKDYKDNGESWEQTRERIKREAVRTGALVMRLLENLPEREWKPVEPMEPMTPDEISQTLKEIYMRGDGVK